MAWPKQFWRFTLAPHSRCLLKPASPETPDIRFPLIEDTHHGAVYVWSPGVRRAPEFLAALKKIYAGDMAQARANAIPNIKRVIVEEVATARFESIVIVTLVDAAETARSPVTWDLADKKIVGWNDLLSDSAPRSRATRAIANAMHLSGEPSAIPLPAFALVPAKDGKSIAGLRLFPGKSGPFGIDTTGSEAHVRFMAAVQLKPWLSEHYRALFGGEPSLFHENQREALVEPISGMSAIILDPPQRPAGKLVFRGEAPITYFNSGTIDVIAEEAKTTFAATGHAVADARPSGVAWNMRVFEVIIYRKLDPFWSVCYDPDGLHFKPARGSPADIAKLAPTTMTFPITYDCGDYGG